MLPELDETVGEGSPQESAGVPANTRERAKKKANRERLTFIYWWPVAESNHGHADFQSAALPTELTGLLHGSRPTLRTQSTKPRPGIRTLNGF